MVQRIRYGIIGCGAMGREHIENIKALAGTGITAIADPHAPSRAAAQALLETPAQEFDHHRDLLGSGLCDALVIATPNFTHITVLRDALATDLHNLVEKPLCTTIEGARAMLDLCMFAENSIDKEHIVVVGDEGKIETMLPSLTLRYGRRDVCKREAWGDGEKSGDGVMVRRVWDASIKYAGQHFGASFVEHRHFAAAIRHGLPADVTLEEGLRCVATGLAAHRSIDTGRMVALAEVLPAGW